MSPPFFATEEDVKVKFLVPYLRTLGYPENCIDYEVAITVQEGRKRKNIFADAVVYSSESRAAPIVLCETKHPREPLSKAVRDQAISYARLLERIAPLALITNGSQTHVFHTLSKVRIPSLPPRAELDQDIFKFVLSKDQQAALRLEAKHELFVIDDVKTFKRILRSCHNEIRNNEGMDPTAAFDEMSKVLFCKLYEEKEQTGAGDRFRLAVYDDSLDRLNVNVIHQILEEAKKKSGYQEILDPDTRVRLKDRTIRKLVELLENYDLSLTAFDVKGEAFEYFLGETFTGGLGEYFTPRNVVEFIVDAVSPKIGEKLVDPFCGTGGFLIYSFDVVSEKIRLNEFADEEKSKWRERLSNASLFGTDWKERTSKACKMNMMVHGDGSSGVFKHDGFRDVPGAIEENTFDLCLTNPPFGSNETDPENLARFELGNGHQSVDRVVLAIERCIKLTKPGGTIAIIVIDGLLNNRTARYVRQFIKKHSRVRGVVSLNPETFEGYGARAKTSVLFLQRRDEPDEEGHQDPTFMAIVRNTGYAPNGDSIPGNELPDVLMDLTAFLRGESDSHQHELSWVSQVEDRLDAEYYQPHGRQSVVALEDIWGGFQRRTAEAAHLIGSSDVVGSFEALDTVRVAIGDLLEEQTERLLLQDEESYRICGVRWWGKGTFLREEKLGKEISARQLRRLRSGWLIYNRLFARKGSFAIVSEEHDGCFVSIEFPTFEAKADVEEPEAVKRFVMHVMNSPRFQHLLDALSTGSTQQSRKRFGVEDFLALEIELPVSGSELRAVVETLEAVDAIRREQEHLAQLSQEVMDGVLELMSGESASTNG